MNPIVDWGSGKLYIPNAVQTALIQDSSFEGDMQAGTVTVLSIEEKLSKFKEEKNKASICALKTPTLWLWCNKSRANYSNGKAKQKKWTNTRALMYDSECISNKNCNIDCKITGKCKLFLSKRTKGLFKVKRLNENAMITIRGTPESGCYDLAAAQPALEQAHG